MTPALNYVSNNKRVGLIPMLNEVDFPALDRARKGANFDGHDETSSGERPAQRYPNICSHISMGTLVNAGAAIATDLSILCSSRLKKTLDTG